MKTVKCRDCGAPCVWLKTRSGKNILVDADTIYPDQEIYEPRRQSILQESGNRCHWNVCPAKRPVIVVDPSWKEFPF